MNRLILIFLLVLPPLLGVAQAQDRKQDAPPPPPVNVLQGGWDNNVANTQAAQWKDANTNAPSNALMQLNWLRSEQNAMIGNNNGVLKTADKAQLDRIANDIRTTAPGSFEQHLADYFVEFPKAAAFIELETAYKLAPERTELLAPMLSKAMLGGDAAELKKWSGEMQRRGGVVPQLKAAAEDVLLSLPSDGILFTNGDMDTQPAVVEQVQRNDKPGVLIVDRRLLAESRLPAAHLATGRCLWPCAHRRAGLREGHVALRHTSGVLRPELGPELVGRLQGPTACGGRGIPRRACQTER